jgi:hypothetical protein
MGQAHSDNDITLVFHSENRTRTPNNSIQALFLMRDLTVCTLNNEIKNLEQNYYQLKNYISTPAILHYDELAQLRRQASNPAVSRQWRLQMCLAVELLRLGRREEAFWILNSIEQRMEINNEQSAVYTLWVAIIKAAAGDYNSAYITAQRLVNVFENQQGRTVLSFFRNIFKSPANSVSRNNLFYQLPDEA